MSDHNLFDFLIVGAGLSGAVLAERFATQRNKKVLIIDKRDHVGGNCFDFIDENGILMNRYGAHLFHTNFDDVWEYVNKFCKWQRWDHRVLGNVDGKLVNIPVNINTVNSLLGTYINSEDEMDRWLKNVQIQHYPIINSRDIAESRVGVLLYNKIFRDYTWKQWGKYPEELDAAVIGRIPVRNSFNDRYFDDRYQALPQIGYTGFVNRLLNHPNISVSTGTDYFDIKNKLKYDIVLFTGPIDHYFREFGLESLEYRSVNFIVERYSNMNYYQPNSVINYLEKNVPYTRIVEYKHFLNQKSPHTTIVKEFTSESGEPFYPVFDQKNLRLYEKYRELSLLEKKVYFLGRLANYKYFNMDQAIKNSLDFYSQFSKI